MKKSVCRVVIFITCSLLQPVFTWGAGIGDYCMTPPFIQQGIKANLLMLIDNSASMYDLVYQDSTQKYCANSPTTACTTASDCPSTGTCLASVTTSSTTTNTAKACTLNSQCPLSPAVTSTTPRPCTAANESTKCTINGDKCSIPHGSTAGYCSKSTDTVVIAQPCQNGYCNTCNTTTGVGDCVSATTTVSTPIRCTSPADCTLSGDTCNNTCTSTRQCYDNTFSSAKTYPGYFDTAATYAYDFTNSNFTTSGVTMPSSDCEYTSGTPKDFCVNTTGSGTSEAVVHDLTGFVATGNFLNWLTASKFDQQKQILTGGKFNTTDGVLQAESRGCSGRKFLKGVPGVNLTFGIWGGTPGGISSTQSQATEYGQTHIGLFAGVYNLDSCMTAIDVWTKVISGVLTTGQPLQNPTKDCVGAGSSVYNSINMWNHISHNCFWGLTGSGYDGNAQALEGECEKVYASLASSGVANPPASITDPSTAIAICSSALTYKDAGGSARTGYIGACYNSGTWDASCYTTQFTNYCSLNVSSSPAIDPSSTSLSASAIGTPGFLLDLGLGNTNSIGTLTAQVVPTAAQMLPTTVQPTGLIYRFKDSIRFGAMEFNIDGSASENASAKNGSIIPNSKYCSATRNRLCFLPSDCPTGESCSTITNKDGGKIVSYVGAGACSATPAKACDVDKDCLPSDGYCIASIGDHTTGLIKALDDMQATTWTPHAEAFYNAVAYYTKDAITTNASLPTGFTPGTSAISTYLAGSDDYTNKNPIQYRCQQNNILLITDGSSTADKNSTMTAKVTDASGNFRDPATTTETTSCGGYAGTPYLHDLSYYARHRNIFDPTASCLTGSGSYICEAAQTIKTYGVFTGPESNLTYAEAPCDPYNQLNRTAANGGTTLYSAVNPSALTASLKAAFEQIATSAASGTAASILSNSEGSGANLLQAVFYPVKVFKDQTSADWIGEMQNFWYYVDPFISNSTIREDTDFTAGTSPTTPYHILDLKKDYAVRFYFANKATSVEVKQDTNGDGVGDVVITAKEDPDDVKSIFRVGKLLWARDASTRTIHTSIDGYSLLSGGFANGSFSGDQKNKYLQAMNDVEANKVIAYIRGTDQTGYRPRQVALTVGGTPREWKLGDIVSSTPRLQSSGKLNSYNVEAPAGYGDTSYKQFINSANYKARGMVYAGANDGMLHAFKLGKLTVSGVTDVPGVTITGDVKATLTGANLGEEQWAYIPRSALPYLKYYSDNTNYKHLFYVDGPTVLVDVATNCAGVGEYSTCAKDTAAGTNWRTLLIGSMGLGGATRSQNPTPSCTASTANGTCVKTPISDPYDTATNPTRMVGYSSYFALDITGQYFNSDGTLANQPTLKWEFPPPDAPDDFGMGYATSGAAVIRVASKLPVDANGVIKPDTSANGKSFAVFASGPTGPIADTRFGGKSDQNLKLFVVDLGASTPLVKDTNYWVIDTGIKRAFAGSILSAAIDTDRWNSSSDGNYQDDALYIGYSKANIADGASITNDTTWTDGGVIRVLTKEDTNPMHWVVSPVISGIGPVTTGIAKLQDRKNKKLWLFFGTGRFYYGGDDTTSQRYIMGVQDRCYTSANVIDKNCDTTSLADAGLASTGKGKVLGLGNLSSQTTINDTSLADKLGWYIALDGQSTSSGYEAERSITDAVALTNGGVFFTTFKPSSDICNYGGNSYMWGVKYDTGGAAPPASLTGKALIQVSTGAFEEITLSTNLTGAGNRKMLDPMTGKPPSDPPPVLSNAANKPVKKILHLQEK